MPVVYHGWEIVREGSLVAIPALHWGPAAHEYYRFRTVRAAKDFIDRRERQAAT